MAVGRLPPDEPLVDVDAEAIDPGERLAVRALVPSLRGLAISWALAVVR